MEGFYSLEGKELTPYEKDKAEGRRLSNGAKPLKKLQSKHLRILAFHLQGMSNSQIAEIVDMTQSRVSLILNDPLSKQYVLEKMAEVNAQVRALMIPATQVVREALGHDDVIVRLNAVEKVYRANGVYERAKAVKGDAGVLTAEDIVAKLIEGTQNGSETTVSISVKKGQTAEDVAQKVVEGEYDEIGE